MTDITACFGKDCLMKDECRRYTCEKDEYCQAYFISSPIKEGKCEHFLSNKKNYEKSKLERINLYIENNMKYLSLFSGIGGFEHGKYYWECRNS